MKTLLLFCSIFLFYGTVSAQVETGNQPIKLPGIQGKWVRTDTADKNPRWAHNINWIQFLPNNNIEWSFNTGPTSKPKIRRGSYTLLPSANLVSSGSNQVLLRIDPKPYNPALDDVHEDGTPIFLMDLQVGKGIDNRFTRQVDLLKFSTQHTEFVFTKSISEQDGGGQPATRPESK